MKSPKQFLFITVFINYIGWNIIPVKTNQCCQLWNDEHQVEKCSESLQWAAWHSEFRKETRSALLAFPNSALFYIWLEFTGVIQWGKKKKRRFKVIRNGIFKYFCSSYVYSTEYIVLFSTLFFPWETLKQHVNA